MGFLPASHVGPSVERWLRRGRGAGATLGLKIASPRVPPALLLSFASHSPPPLPSQKALRSPKASFPTRFGRGRGNLREVNLHRKGLSNSSAGVWGGYWAGGPLTAPRGGSVRGPGCGAQELRAAAGVVHTPEPASPGFASARQLLLLPEAAAAAAQQLGGRTRGWGSRWPSRPGVKGRGGLPGGVSHSRWDKDPLPFSLHDE